MTLSVSCRVPTLIVDAECDSLASCLPMPWPHIPSTPVLEAGCNVATAASLRELLQDNYLIGNASDEIIRRFELSADELIVETFVGAVDFTWWYLGNRYTLYLQEGKHPLGNVFFEKSTPLLKQIVDCLGEPESYTSGYTPHELFIFSLGLYFPEYGVVAHSTQVTRQENIVFNEELKITRLILVPSGTTDFGQANSQQLDPWPGSLEIVIETIQAGYCLNYPEFCPTTMP
jgi:hypothetical protein